MRNLNAAELAKLEELSDGAVNTPKFAWSDDFQRKLLAMLLTDQYMLVQAFDKIKAEYFSNEAHVLITRILIKYFQERKAVPEKWIVEQELGEQLKERDRSVLLHYMAELNSVYAYYVPGLETREYLIDKVTYFAKVQATKMAFHASMEKMQEAPEDENTWNFIHEQFRQAMIIDRSYEPGFEYFMNLDEMFNRMDSTFEGKDRFTSAFPSIDNALEGGGLFAGQMGAWIAMSGVGKSLCLSKAAVANVMLGHKVLYLTMELNELDVAKRFTSQFMKLDIKNLRGVREDVIKTANEFKNQFDDPNLLHVKQFPGGVIDMNGIRSYIAQLELRKWVPNLLIVDYVGEMKDDPLLKKYESAYRIVRDLRGYSVEKNFCTLTCLQANASAAKLEVGQYIDESNIGVAYDQCKPLDALWSLNQQVIEKDAEVGRAFVVKHRAGRSRFPFKIGFDYNLGTLDVFEISKEKYREQMNLVQEKKAQDVNIDSVDVGGKKQRSKKGFKGDDPTEDTYEAE